MKQILQQPRSGDVAVTEVPSPKLLPGCVLVRMAASLVSAGTERASCEFANKNLVQKAKARPDLVREVINKIQRDGVFSAIAAVRGRLDQAIALGYSSSGTVIGVGEGVTDLNVGDRVACAGAGYAVHAEFACIPRLLTARVHPDSALSFDEAAFTTLGAVALHGVRTADVKLGDVVAVIGLGLLGQLTVQILKAAGCRVLGMDIVPERAELASRLGADEVSITRDGLRDLCLHHSNGHGADAVLITAETASSAPLDVRFGQWAWISSANSTLKRSWISVFRVPTGRAVTIRRMSRRGAIIRSATCVGPRRETWRPFSSFCQQPRSM